MHIELMRKIDYWLGIPLCFISSLWYWLKKALGYYNTQTNQLDNKTLVIGLSEMGSMVLAQPALYKLAEHSSLYFVSFKNNQSALEMLNIIPDNHIFTLDTSNIFVFTKNCMQFFAWTREKKITSIIDLELFSRFSALLGTHSGAIKHIGFYAYNTEGLYRGTFFSHPVAYNPHIHISKNFLQLAHAAAINVVDKKQLPLTKLTFSSAEISLKKMTVTEIEQAQIKQIIKNYFPAYKQQQLIIINSEGGDLLPMRNWGQDKFYELITLILNKNKSILILLTGSSGEKSAVEKLNQRVNHTSCVNFAGAVNLTQLLALYSIGQFMVTNDSGPNHFSSLTSLRTYALFGPETPRLYGSLGNAVNIYKNLSCSPCVTAANQRKTVCCDNLCMQQISAEEVYQRILDDGLLC
jgi:ADP-heptose:LPS heptosyltransferase